MAGRTAELLDAPGGHDQVGARGKGMEHRLNSVARIGQRLLGIGAQRVLDSLHCRRRMSSERPKSKPLGPCSWMA